MKNRIGAIVTLAVLFSANAAAEPTRGEEQQIVHRASTSMSELDWRQTVSLPRFDPGLGDLRAVRIQLRSVLVGTLQLETVSVTGSVARSTYGAFFELQVPIEGGRSHETLLETHPAQTHTAILEPFDGILDFNGPSSETLDRVALLADASTRIERGGASEFVGEGRVVLPVYAAFAGSIQGRATMMALNARGAVSVVLAYVYEPTQEDRTDVQTHSVGTGQELRAQQVSEARRGMNSGRSQDVRNSADEAGSDLRHGAELLGQGAQQRAQAIDADRRGVNSARAQGMRTAGDRTDERTREVAQSAGQGTQLDEQVLDDAGRRLNQGRRSGRRDGGIRENQAGGGAQAPAGRRP